MIEQLEWDSNFFGWPIARFVAPRAQAPELDQALEECQARGIELLYFLAELSSPATLAAACARGFSLVDVRVELDVSISSSVASPAGTATKIHEAGPKDLAELRDLAARSHVDSRFYADPRIPRERCDALYAAWIERSVAGWAATVKVATLEGRLAGYITCHLEAEGVGSIGLIAVSEIAQGQGVGGILVADALRFFGDAGCRRVRVVTQGANIRAQRLYQKFGFRTERSLASFHRWAPFTSISREV